MLARYGVPIRRQVRSVGFPLPVLPAHERDTVCEAPFVDRVFKTQTLSQLWSLALSLLNLWQKGSFSNPAKLEI